MPTDTNDNSNSSTSMTTVIENSITTNNNNNNNNSEISSVTSNTSSPSPPQTTTIRPNSPNQTSPKQLDKLRRFLSTLYYFGLDISSDIGEHVRALILALVNNALSVEEFHGKLQTTTNFPLRPFALPFLKSTLPVFQNDLIQSARQSKQSISQYLAQHEDFIFLPRELLEMDISPSKESINENGKRKLSNDSNEIDERKRSLTTHRTFINPSVRRDKERTFSSYLREYTNDYKDLDDHWKNAENMLNYILEMVTKSKRVLFILQQKDIHLRRLIESNDLEWRRRHAELLAQTEDRIVEIRRKAEETVLEIKRQSIIDLQKAVSQTEQKSNEILLREREQYQRIKAQTFEEAYNLLNRQDDSPENCWHCGRKAIETCSACNVARYCGPYCQHRDWEFHQKLCGPDLKKKINDDPQFHRRLISKPKELSLSKDEQTDISNEQFTLTKTESN